MPSAPEPAPPAISPNAMLRSGLCIGCGGCVAQAGRGDVHMAWNAYGQLQPTGARDWLATPSPTLARTCPFSPFARDEDDLAAGNFPAAPNRDWHIGRYEAAYVGHAAETGFRAQGSSGGMVSWVATELLRRGLVDGVAHVAPADDGAFFRYVVSRSPEQIHAGAKSRYYPIELSGVIETIRTVPGRYAVVGIPCFIKAVHLLRAQDPVLAERIAFTLGLFCGHMKSARFVESFAWQMDQQIDAVEKVDYRLKNADRPANWYTAQLTDRSGEKHVKDWWHLADGDWGAGFFQSPACNFCDDVVAETADIAFGDAWVEPYASDGRGTNVVIVRSPQLKAILDEGMAQGRLALDQVDHEFIRQTQAAGFRQRREGLAFRLTWPRLGIKPKKRVAPGAEGLSLRRRLIYFMRYQISAWSHRMFWLARRLDRPLLYLRWARLALSTYHGLAYSRGRIGQIMDRLGLKGREG